MPPSLVSTVPPTATADHVQEIALARCVFDVIYHPWPTPLAQAVQHQGSRLVTGLDMLLHQAFAQVQWFTSLPAPRRPPAESTAPGSPAHQTA